MKPRLNERTAAFDSPFRRLDALLADIVPNPALRPIAMHVGEPKDAPPAMLANSITAHSDEWNRYPPSIGTPELVNAVIDYLGRRYPTVRGRIAPDGEMTSISSSREGLFLAAMVGVSPTRERALALMPNPFYQTYRAGSLMAGAQPRYLAHSGFPRFDIDLDSLDQSTLADTAIMFLCSPANPDGNVISPATMRRAIKLARQYGFLLVFDECYGELYDRAPPVGVLEVLAQMRAGPDWLDNVLVLHSLSKRSSAAGMRSGMAIGAPEVIAALNRVRLNGTACTPMPLQAAAAALWSDDVHVEEMRARLRARFDLADRYLGGHAGYYRPPCGFFLWLCVGDGAALTRRLWSEHALRVLPGEYLTQPAPDGTNAGKEFVRLAMVHDLATTEEGLARLARAIC